ncbi:Sulfate transporter [Hypsibius exemplaris]|uniref:Sulfate transporter n=1 Tax=Hypsibius exemplaris TaxID=2072580 RepID=A0A1W0X330_HYPEX|nr:Sulfate transporter [Hypsibius exemplaris]
MHIYTTSPPVVCQVPANKLLQLELISCSGRPEIQILFSPLREWISLGLGPMEKKLIQVFDALQSFNEFTATQTFTCRSRSSKTIHRDRFYAPVKHPDDAKRDANGALENFKLKLGHSKFCRQSAFQNVATIFPILEWIMKYDLRKNLLKDFIAGLTVGTIAVPQALGYAVVAGVTPIFGLYTCFIPPLIYSLMGTSRHVSVGVFALVCLMTGEVLTDAIERQDVRMGLFNQTLLLMEPGGAGLDGLSPPPVMLSGSQIVSTLAFAIGLWQVVMGILGLGFVTVYLSDRVVQGFACGAAFHIFNTQLKWIFGLSYRKRRGLFCLPLSVYDFVVALPSTHLPTFLVSLVCLTALITARFLNGNAKVMKVIRFPIPMELLVIVFGSVASYFMNLRAVYAIDIIRSVPLGFPSPQLPAFHLLPELFHDSFIIAVIAFSVAISAGRVFAQKHHYSIDSNQELRALGVVNLVGGFFQCLPSAVALARSVVQESAGGVTQVVSIVSASLIFLVITVLGPLLEPVPKACLGCIVVIALIPMILKIMEVGNLWKVSRLEAVIFLIPCLAIILLDVEIGLALGIAFSLLIGVVWRTQERADIVQVLGRTEHSGNENDSHPIITNFPSSNVIVIRIATPLHFANAELCLNKARKLIGRSLRSNSYAPSAATRIHLPDVEGDDSKHSLIGSPLPDPVTDKNGAVKADTSSRKSDGRELIQVTQTLSSIRLVVLDLSAVSFIDMTGVQLLKKFRQDCRSIHACELVLAGCLDPVKEMLIAGGKFGDIPPNFFFDTVSNAVDALMPQKFEALSDQVGSGI